VFLCITLLVQELKESGALTALGQTLPGFLLSTGTPLLGWMGSSFIGTSTITNMMFAKLIDPVRFSALAAGSAIGVQMAVQSSAAMRSVLHERLSEKEIFLNIAPFSAVFILLANAFYFILA
jgi:L-lactate permease